MLNIIKRFGRSWVPVLLLVFLCGANVYGRIVTNGAGGGFCPLSMNSNCDDGGELVGTARINSASSIENLIEEGGSYYLEAMSGIAKLSAHIERYRDDALNFKDLECVTGKIHEDLSNAILYYSLLIQMAEVTPYNTAVISKLREFDYSGYQVANGLNREIFGEVTTQLKSGHIIGIFNRLHDDMVSLEDILLSVRQDIRVSKPPEIKSIWLLNEKAYNIFIFGQYVARVFSALQ